MSDSLRIHPVVLEGMHVRLEPLSLNHHSQLCEIAFDDDLWRLTMTVMKTPDDMSAYIQSGLQAQQNGTALPFVIIEKSSGMVVGSTRYGNIDTANRRVEIGWTWVASQWQRSIVNTETKYLLLCHAFETLGCIRVEFKTDSTNERSRAALLRIGAKEEGTLRNHMITPGGRIRHSVYFSILDNEWQELKRMLGEKMNTKR